MKDTNLLTNLTFLSKISKEEMKTSLSCVNMSDTY